MESTKDRITQTLLRKPRSTINELAEAVGINPISVRHHLTNLQMEGLIEAAEERHGVGRPRLVYFLTEDGLEQFPTRYLRLTSRLLQQMKGSLPAPMVTALFTQMANDMASEYTGQLKDMSMEERLDAARELLAQEGFVVEWEKSGQDYHVHEISCPYLQVGQSHPEICTVDQTLLSNMLAVPAEKVRCILSGDAHCTYVISPANIKKVEEL